MTQFSAQRLQVCDLLVDVREMIVRQRIDRATIIVPMIPQPSSART